MSTHKLTTTLGIGDPDIGAEVELTITFNYTKGAPAQPPAYSHGGLPADPDEVEFVSCVGPYEGDGYDNHRQVSYDVVAQNWIESDAGYNECLAQVTKDLDEAAEAGADW